MGYRKSTDNNGESTNREKTRSITWIGTAGRLTVEVTGSILAGGKSRRLGQDKALLRVGTRSLLEIVAQTVVDVLGTACVVGRSRPPEWDIAPVTFRSDDQPEQGPMGGLATTLRATDSAVLLLGCDMPALQPETLEWLLTSDRQLAARDGLITLNDNRPEPLFSIYRQTCLPAIDRCLNEGRFSLLDVIDDGEFARLHVPPELQPHLVNINDPGDLERYLRR